MKKLLLTSVMAMSVIGGANAIEHLAPDMQSAGGWIDRLGGSAGETMEDLQDVVQAAMNNLANIAEDHALELERQGQIMADWNVLFFGENGDGTAGLFHDFYSAFNTVANARFDQLELSVAQLDRKMNDMNKDLSAGIASVAALSSVAVADVKRGEVSVGGGYGYHNGQSAAAFGMAAGITDNWSMNAGVGLSSADTTFRAGTNYKFKLF